MRKLFCMLLSFISLHLSGQLQNANWRFAENAGLDFNGATFTIPPAATYSAINFTNPGGSGACASVSDVNGQLLFYTDGINVWGNNNLPLSNGTDLHGYSDEWAQQRVVIVPKPGNANRYYIFTLGSISQLNGSSPVNRRGGIHYSVVDFSSGNGQVVPGLKNIPVKNTAGDLIDYPLDPNHTEDNPVFITGESRMTTTLHSSGKKIWVSIIADFYFNTKHTRKFMNFLVSSDGINDVVDGISPSPNVETLIDPSNYVPLEYSVSAMKISPNGALLCDAEDVVNLYAYNNQDGTIAFTKRIFTPSLPTPEAPVGYGIDFSPDNAFIYFTFTPIGVIQGNAGAGEGSPGTREQGILYQYQLSKEQLELISLFPLPSPPSGDNGINPIPSPYAYGLQLAMDNKIYVCVNGNPLNHVGVINLPTIGGTGCNFDPLGGPFLPGSNPNHMLPQWVHKAIVPEVWPKIYSYASSAKALLKDQSGNVILKFDGRMLQTINHTGALPPTSTTTKDLTLQYNSSGFSGWYREDPFVTGLFCSILKNDDVQNIDADNISGNSFYFSGITGSTTTPPSSVPANERIIAEPANGTYITSVTASNGTNDLHVISNTGSSTINLSTSPRIFGFYSKFNPSTQKLFLFTQWNDPGQVNRYGLKIYQLAGTTLNLLLDNTNYIPYQFIQVDNADNIYVLKDNKVQKYDYLSNTYTIQSITNFTNSNILRSLTDNLYTDDRCLVFNVSEDNIYSLDFSSLTSKKIHTTGNIGFEFSRYLYHGNTLYLSGWNRIPRPDATIGNQVIPILDHSIFLTKLDLIADFSFRPSPGTYFSKQNHGLPEVEKNTLFKNDILRKNNYPDVTLSPNPAKDQLSIQINESDFLDNSPYTVIIWNNAGQKVTEGRYTINPAALNIQALKKGTYLVSIKNRKGNTITKSFIKL